MVYVISKQTAEDDLDLAQYGNFKHSLKHLK